MAGVTELTVDLGRPNPRQRLFLADRHKYVAFGGARGGGKSWAVRTKNVLLAMAHPGITQMIMRRSYPELYANHIKPLLATLPSGSYKYNDTKKEMRFANGSQTLFRYCNNDRDLLNYQGTETDILYIDEATQFTEEQFRVLVACVRGANDFPKRVYLTCNPGGVGHGWVKRLFVDKHYNSDENPEEYSFIQSLVTDNQALMREQPDYVKQLEALAPKLRDAWLYGNWDVYEGQFFEEFTDDPTHYKDRRYTHVIAPFEITADYKLYRSFDWGYSHPFSCGWWAVDSDGVAYRILELYGCTGTPDEGVKWTPDRVFREIKRIESEHRWLKGRRIIGVADPAIWSAETGESIAETAAKAGVHFSPGDHQRLPGWMQMHYRMAFDANGYAMMYVFSNCKAFIRTIPLLQYDDHRPEDLDTAGEDHCLAGDTLVLTDGGYRRIDELVGTEGRVMSHDGAYHRYRDVRMTRKQTDVLRIEMDDGTVINCTDDHRFMLPDGGWITAGGLSAGMEVKALGSDKDQQHCAEI